MSKKEIERNQRLVSLREKGYSYGDIASVFNISRQRVYQITSGYQDILTSLNHTGKRNTKNHSLVEIRRFIFKRDQNTCQRCGATKHTLIHHLDDNDRNNTLTNLILLCTTCHLNLHRPKQRVSKIIKDTPKMHYNPKLSLLERVKDTFYRLGKKLL